MEKPPGGIGSQLKTPGTGAAPVAGLLQFPLVLLISDAAMEFPPMVFSTPRPIDVVVFEVFVSLKLKVTVSPDRIATGSVVDGVTWLTRTSALSGVETKTIRSRDK